MKARVSGAFVGLLAVSFGFVFFAMALGYGYLFPELDVFGVMLAALFAAYAYMYAVIPGRRRLLYAVLCAYVLIFIAAFVSEPIAAHAVGLHVAVGFAVHFVLYLVLFLPVTFTFFIGAYLLRIAKRRRLAATVFCLAAGLMVAYYLYRAIFIGYNMNDEMYITFVGIRNLMRGINPYATNIAQMLYYNRTIVGMSITTNNAIVGVMDYPALYFLSALPFYFVSQPTLANFMLKDMNVQALTSLFVMLLAIVLLVDKRHLKKPPYGLLAILFLAIPVITSVQTYLMFALLAIAYAKIDNRYSWVFLGIAASIQEELWMPVILLIVYSFVNRGIGTGLKNAFGAVGVFLIVNSYFILLGPTAFFASVFSPVSRYLFTTPVAPIGFLLLTHYHMLYGTFPLEFALSFLFMLTLFAYVNRKELVGLFSMLPFFFLSHSLPDYYAFFILFFVFSFYAAKSKGGISGSRHVYRLVKGYVAAILILIAFTMIVVGYNSHQEYVRGFNVSVANQSAYLSYHPNATNATYYQGEVRYSGISNRTLYLVFAAYSRTTIGLEGFSNMSLINNSAECNGSYQCLVNVNRITLNGSSGVYRIYASIPWNGNKDVTMLEPFLYNGRYFYAAPIVRTGNQ